jgi:hypothetical protein
VTLLLRVEETLEFSQENIKGTRKAKRLFMG